METSGKGQLILLYASMADVDVGGPLQGPLVLVAPISTPKA
jgi:hypothetical protein